MPSKPAHQRGVRNRHLARVCTHCSAPMASGADTCWRCGTQWATEAQPPAKLQLVADPAPEATERPVPVEAAAAAAVRS